VTWNHSFQKMNPNTGYNDIQNIVIQLLYFRDGRSQREILSGSASTFPGNSYPSSWLTSRTRSLKSISTIKCLSRSARVNCILLLASTIPMMR
jgi:hypothetical protein